MTDATPFFDPADRPGQPVHRDLGAVSAEMQLIADRVLTQVYWPQRAIYEANLRRNLSALGAPPPNDAIAAQAIETAIAADFVESWAITELDLTPTAARQLLSVLSSSLRPVPVTVAGRLVAMTRLPWPAVGWVLTHALALLALGHRHALVPIQEHTDDGLLIVTHRIGGLSMPVMAFEPVGAL